jgi:hypothetical protein
MCSSCRGNLAGTAERRADTVDEHDLPAFHRRSLRSA